MRAVMSVDAKVEKKAGSRVVETVEKMDCLANQMVAKRAAKKAV